MNNHILHNCLELQRTYLQYMYNQINQVMHFYTCILFSLCSDPCHVEYFMYYTPLRLLSCKPATFKLSAFVFNLSGKKCILIR